MKKAIRFDKGTYFVQVEELDQGSVELLKDTTAFLKYVGNKPLEHK